MEYFFFSLNDFNITYLFKENKLNNAGLTWRGCLQDVYEI